MVYDRELANITESIYQTSNSFYLLTQEMVDNNLKVADHFVKDRTSIDSNYMIEMEIENQINHHKKPARIPVMKVRNFMGLNEFVSENNELVDYVTDQIGCSITIFQLIDDGLLRISTSVKRADSSRITGTFIPLESPVYKMIVSGEPYHGRAFVDNEWYIAAYKPIYQNSKLIGAIYVGLKQSNLKFLGEVIKSFKLGETYFPSILNTNGEVVIHPNIEEGTNLLGYQDLSGSYIIKEICDDIREHKTYAGQKSYRWADQQNEQPKDRILYFRYLPQMDWIIAVEIEKEQIFSPLTKQISISIFIALLLFVIVFVFIILVGNRFTRQLNYLTESVEKYSKRDFSVRAPVLSNDEIGLLSLTFNNLATELQGFYEGLESRIKERTTELYVKNEALLEQKKETDRINRGIRAINDELRSVNEALKESEEKYRRLVENLKEEYIFYSHIPHGLYQYISPSVENVLGISVKKAMDGFTQYMTENPINKKAIIFMEKSVKGEKQDPFNVEIFDSKGKPRMFEISESAITRNGKVIAIEGLAKDITNYFQAQESLKISNLELNQQKEELQVTLENLKETQEQLVQSEKLAALGQLIAGLAHEINTPLGAINASSDNLTESLQTAVENLPQLIRVMVRDGIQLFIKLLKYVERDLPELSSKEKRALKKQIIILLEQNSIKHAEVMADNLIFMNIYNNYDDIMPLLKLAGAAFILDYTRNIVSLLNNTNNISLAVERASRVVFALKKYIHHDQSEEKLPANIQDGIETVLTIYNSLIKEGIILDTQFDDIPPVPCVADEMNQVWTNLIHNALQAMNYQGILKIKISKQKGYARVEISDSGCGIPEDIKERIFDPFFTTKPSGEGSGMGLDIVKNIIEKHRGKIELESEVGIGTSFVILLPYPTSVIK